MSCKSAGLLGSALLGLALLAGCARRDAGRPIERIAILRFENLGADAADGWMGRALSEVLIAELSGRPGRSAVSGNTLHSFERATGARPASVPGISTEDTVALLAGATEVGYGEYAVRGGRLEARLTLMSQATRKTVKVVSASRAAGDVLGVGDALARQLASDLSPAGVHNNEALRAYVTALESGSAEASEAAAAAAIAADPDFGPPYRLLAERKLEGRDREAALAILDQARTHALPPLEQARVALAAATFRNDIAARLAALREVAQGDPANAEHWTALGEASYATHANADAAAAFRKVVALDPKNRNALNMLAYACARNNEVAAAIEALEKYQALAPNDPNALDSLGDVSLSAGRLADAERYYLAAFQKNPRFFDGADLFKAAMARLMRGDVAGATELHKRYLAALNTTPGRITAVEIAEWAWITGHRTEAYRGLAAFARGAENGPQREAAQRAYAELAIWSLMLGDRAAAGDLAKKALGTPGGPVSATAVLAYYLTLPPASPQEWAVRSDKIFANPALAQVRGLAIACALLVDKQYQPAAAVLENLYRQGISTSAGDGLAVMLAWALMETGRANEAAPLLRVNPIPPTTGLDTFVPFYFPRLYYLRAAAAANNANAKEAQDGYRQFLQLSGDAPLLWGEEKRAPAAR